MGEVDFVEVLEMVLPLVALVESFLMMFSTVRAEGGFLLDRLCNGFISTYVRPVS